MENKKSPLTKVTIEGRDFYVATDQDGNQFIPARCRINAFVTEHPNWALDSSVIISTEGALAETRITDENGTFKSNGHCWRSREDYGRDFVSIAETESKQRAIAFLGFGLMLNISSHEAMQDFNARKDAGALAVSSLKKKVVGGA